MYDIFIQHLSFANVRRETTWKQLNFTEEILKYMFLYRLHYFVKPHGHVRGTESIDHQYLHE